MTLDRSLGDPWGMRELAGRLQGIAASLAADGRSVQGAVSAIDFQGPAGDHLRASAAGWSATYVRHAAELQAVAAALERAAFEAEQAAAIGR